MDKDAKIYTPTEVRTALWCLDCPDSDISPLQLGSPLLLDTPHDTIVVDMVRLTPP